MSARQDALYMARAIYLAKKGRYTTDPNPRVGCVLVRNDVIIGEGWHVKAGFGHAEVEALKNVQDAQGATAYVTLEPCSHHGKTPPCTDLIIRSGIKKVLIGMPDPNPLVNGQGIAVLKQHGIVVQTGILESECKKLNEVFIKFITSHKPFVVFKLSLIHI